MAATLNLVKRYLSISVLLLLALLPAAQAGLASGWQASGSAVPTLGVVQQWSLAAPDGKSLDEFGSAVAIDGNTAVIGARNADPDLGGGAVSNAGAAYVYVRSSNTWVLEARLTADDAAAGDTFGVSVGISGNTIVVGATGVDLADEDQEDGWLDDAGAAYVFARSSGKWVQQAILTAADPAEDDSFGSGVAVDKSTVVVAAETKDMGTLIDVGAAYVFYRSSGKNWSQQARLLPPDPWLGDYFGTSVAVQGDLIGVGAPQFNLTGESGPGKVWVFRRSGKTWQSEARLEAENGRAGDAFGNSLAIHGKTIVVGAYHADPDLGGGQVTSAGAAYVFSDRGDEWVEEAMLAAQGAQVFERLGQAVDIYGDTVVVGADGAVQAGNNGAGAVYIFKKSKGAWNMQTRAVTDPAGENDLFGKSVALSRDWFVAGASGRNLEAKTRAGEAFLNLLGAVQLPATGFAPDVHTPLPAQPAALAYSQQDEMSLEIPALGQKMAILGVPKSGSGWDVRWLGGEAGYLEGTAYPTWEGNSGLAGHSTLADGSPGPFANLQTLQWGDRVIIHAWGQRYIYEVRENSMVSPDQLKVLRHEERAWVTLITCQGYDEADGAYRWRRVVQGGAGGG